jgi:deazaflavin-dependent oxidoreductase (nitroreductase family)
MKLGRIFNKLVVALLDSPLHGILSGSMAVIEYTGRKSGRSYRVPVEYIRDGDALLIFSRADRVWWRNFQAEAAVSLRLRGETVQAVAQSTVGDVETLGRAMQVCLTKHPNRAGWYGLELDAHNNPTDDSLHAAAEQIVVVQVRLSMAVSYSSATL